MQESWRKLVLSGLIGAFIGTWGVIGFYELFRPAVITAAPDINALFSLAIVGMYLVALLMAVLSLGFAVFGKQWISGMVEAQIHERLMSVEKRSLSIGHGRVAYVLWQLSCPQDDERRKEYLNEAIELTRRCYHDDHDPNQDIKLNEANNLASFLAERNQSEDVDEAIELSKFIKERSKKTKHELHCARTYAQVVIMAAGCGKVREREIVDALTWLKHLDKRNRNRSDRPETMQLIEALERANGHL